ncbi:MAG: HAMP domain-containing sensor histidine kinase [Rikenellaceae bacterium]
MDRGVIRSTGDLQNLQNQDWYREKGNTLDIHLLDSLFRSRIDRNYKSKLCLLDEEDCTLCIKGDSVEYNYTTRKFPIGLQGKQSIIAEVDITPSYFIKISVATLVLSSLILLFSLLSLLYLMTILRRKDETLKQREVNINGIIHDLKSPLAGVYAMLDLYHLMEQDEDRKSSYKRNKQSVKLICTNIERLLSTAKDEIEITKTTISRDLLREHIETLIEGLTMKYRDKEIRTTTSYGDFEEVNIDTISLDSVITNLVENAIKYSTERVNISIDVNLSNEQLHIVVSDDGVGIAQREQRRIFDYLYRGSSDCNGRGMGIGLTYTKAVATAHGGDAKLAWSEVGVGSKFEVILNVE